jgi:basic membrane lipoprotein Med (substrate-binding protein (PBP1-ABC) superfamily)
VAIGIVVVLIRSAPADPEPRARIYRDLDACLLTDSHGIAGTPSSTVWQGMQDYSRRTAVRVSYVPVIGAETTSDAEQFLAGLIQRRCAVIITTGDTQNAAAVTAAAGTAQTEFVIVGSTNEDHPNLTPLAPDDPHLAESVASTLTQLIPSS